MGKSRGAGSGKAVTLGARVRVYPGTQEQSAGVVVEDFGDYAGHAVIADGNHIVDAARRWAVALDDGRLVFVDDGHITLE